MLNFFFSFQFFCFNDEFLSLLLPATMWGVDEKIISAPKMRNKYGAIKYII